jgi:tape measure domain-containing protein
VSTETVDIIVKENGSAAAAANVSRVGTAASTSSAQMEKLLLTLQGSNLKLAEVARATGSMEAQMMSLGRTTSATSAAHKEHNEQMTRGAEQAGRLREMLIAVGLALGVHEWVELTDQYQKNVNGLVQVTTSQQNLVDTQRALKEISMDTFSSLDVNTTLYVRLSKAGKDLNLTQEQMVTVVRTLNEGLRLAGNSSSDAGRAISQLSIAMMTGEGSSRAMMSIMRQMPDLTQAVAQKFFTGRDSVKQFKEAVESGALPIRNVMIALTGLSDGYLVNIDSIQKAAAETKTHSTVLQTETEKLMIAEGRMYDFSKATLGADHAIIDLSHSSAATNQSVQGIAQHAAQAGHAVSGMTSDLAAMGPVAASATRGLHAGIVAADNQLSKFAQNVKKIEPTIADAWTNMKTALFSYVGEADQASGASEKIAHMIQLAATNGRVFFGVIGVITAFLGTYATAAGLAAAGTFLFVSAFSRLALAVSIVAALVVAVYTFGQSIKITADGSVTAMGAVLAVFDLVRQGVMAVWNLVQQAPGYWGPAIVAVGGLTLAMRIFLGVNLISFLVTAVAYLGAFTLATIAALGPWGLLTAAIVAATLAWAYWSGQLDGAIATLKEKLTPVVNNLIAKMKEFSKEAGKSGTAAKEFGNIWSEETARVTNGFEQGLLPSIRNVDAALAKLKSDAVADMGATKTAVTDVAAALNAVTASANASDSAVGKVASTAGKNTSSSGSDPKTYIFGGLNYYPRTDGLDQAFARAVQISGQDGNKFQNSDSVVQMIKRFAFGGSWDPTMMAEITHALSNMSSGGKGYLKTIFPWIPGLQYGGNFTVGGQGGTDSQLVQFMATPGEQVNVSTPSPSGATGGSGGGVHVNMIVVAQDAQSFTKSQDQIVQQLHSRLQRVAMRSGG